MIFDISSFSHTVKFYPKFYPYIYIYIHIYIYIYIYACVCVCVCVYLGSISSWWRIWLNSADFFCLHIFAFILSSCSVNVLISGCNWLIISYCDFKGSKQKYVDKRCLYYLIKYVSIKKCCPNTYILDCIILQLTNITTVWNTDVYTSLILAQDGSKITREPINYGKFISQFWLDN